MFFVTYLKPFNDQGKGKSVPLQAWNGPDGSRKLKFPDFMTTAQEGGKVVSLTHRPHLPPGKFSWYPFLLEAESTPGPKCDRNDYVNGKFQLHHPLTYKRRIKSHLPFAGIISSPYSTRFQDKG